MAVPYYIELFRTGADRHNGILMFLLLLVAETTTLMADYEFHFMKSSPDLIWVRALLLWLKVIISTTSLFYSLEKCWILKLSRLIKIIQIP